MDYQNINQNFFNSLECIDKKNFEVFSLNAVQHSNDINLFVKKLLLNTNA